MSVASAARRSSVSSKARRRTSERNRGVVAAQGGGLGRRGHGVHRVFRRAVGDFRQHPSVVGSTTSKRSPVRLGGAAPPIRSPVRRERSRAQAANRSVAVGEARSAVVMVAISSSVGGPMRIRQSEPGSALGGAALERAGTGERNGEHGQSPTKARVRAMDTARGFRSGTRAWCHGVVAEPGCPCSVAWVPTVSSRLRRVASRAGSPAVVVRTAVKIPRDCGGDSGTRLTLPARAAQTIPGSRATA